MYVRHVLFGVFGEHWRVRWEVVSSVTLELAVGESWTSVLIMIPLRRRHDRVRAGMGKECNVQSNGATGESDEMAVWT